MTGQMLWEHQKTFFFISIIFWTQKAEKKEKGRKEPW
jgi:hypothetical protein